MQLSLRLLIAARALGGFIFVDLTVTGRTKWAVAAGGQDKGIYWCAGAELAFVGFSSFQIQIIVLVVIRDQDNVLQWHGDGKLHCRHG